jgi:hypothetical protein
MICLKGKRMGEFEVKGERRAGLVRTSADFFANDVPPPLAGLPADRLALSRSPGRPPGMPVDRLIAEKIGVAAFSIGMVGGTIAGIAAVVASAPVWVPLAFLALAGAGALTIAVSGTSRRSAPAGN